MKDFPSTETISILTQMAPPYNHARTGLLLSEDYNENLSKKKQPNNTFRKM